MYKSLSSSLNKKHKSNQHVLHKIEVFSSLKKSKTIKKTKELLDWKQQLLCFACFSVDLISSHLISSHLISSHLISSDEKETAIRKRGFYSYSKQTQSNYTLKSQSLYI
jgi:hypothetical protein